MSSDDESNPLDVLKPGDLDALIKPPPEEDAPELSGALGDVKAPWVGAEENWRAGSAEDESTTAQQPPAGDEDPGADLGALDGARLSDIDMTSAARAAAALPPRQPGLSARARRAIIAVAILVVVGLIGTLWLLDLRDEYLHRQKLANLRDRDETSTRLQLASLLFGADEERPERDVDDEGDQEPGATEGAAFGSDHGGETRGAVRGSGGDDEPTQTDRADTDEGYAAIEDNPFGEDPGTAAADDAPAAPAPRKPDQLSELLEGADAVDGDQLRADRDGPADESAVIVLEGEQFNKLPERPSREQVKTALDGVAGAVQRCGQGTGGQMLIRVQVAGFTGRVTGAQVLSKEHQGTSAATCAARAVRAAKFPKFSKETISIKYPFDL